MFKKKWHLFKVYGIEIEYMIVDRNTLEVRPLADILLADNKGVVHNNKQHGEITWCNELAMHVIELNFSKPESTLSGKSVLFQTNIRRANEILSDYNAMLLPGAMHPWLNPAVQDVKLWPFELTEIYKTFHRIFNCREHGWVNVQSMHLNLPFSGGREFKKLHSAIRFILPLIPALAASSPVVEGKLTNTMDNRLSFYKNNQRLVPEIAGDVIPEMVNSPREYKTKILKRMYKAVSRYDHDKILQEEWLNSRGAIARFYRSAIEIRVIDTQECVTSDLAVADIICHLLKWLVFDRVDKFQDYHNFPQNDLVSIFNHCIQSGDQAVVENEQYLSVFNLHPRHTSVSGRDLWSKLIQMLLSTEKKREYQSFIDEYQTNGTLANRITLAKNTSELLDINQIYRKLAVCLNDNTVFSPYDETMANL